MTWKATLDGRDVENSSAPFSAQDKMIVKIPISFGSAFFYIAIAFIFILSFLLHVILGVPFSVGIMSGVIALCILGGILGLVMSFNLVRIFLKCPICRSYGIVSFGFLEGFAEARPLFDCPHCGRLANKSYWSFHLEKIKETVCPNCGYEYKEADTICPYCQKGEKGSFKA